MPGGQEPREHPRLSLTQIAASTLAAVTTTLALSWVGVAGTILGAGLASVVTVLGNHLYTQSIDRTRRQVQARLRSPYAARGDAPNLSPTVALDVAQAPGDAGTHEAAGTSRGVLALVNRKRLVVSALALFAVIMAVVTVLELAAGRPLSDVVQGRDGGGTTVFGGQARPTPSATASTATSTGTSTMATTTTSSASTSTVPVLPPSSTSPSVTLPTTAPTSSEVVTTGTGTQTGGG